MGNGVTTSHREGYKKYVTDKNEDVNDYSRIDQLCRSDYYLSHSDEYESTARSAISTNQLDILESLVIVKIPGKKISLLHMAALYASLDSVELLISAGFRADEADKLGKTPLHLVCERTKTSPNTSTCITSLHFHAPSSLSRYDKGGFLPLHSAIKSNNLVAVQTLLQLGSSSSAPTKNGISARSLAQNLEKHDIVQLIDNHVKATASQSAPLDPARIMLIWERFFENAFKSNFGDEDEDDVASNDMRIYDDGEADVQSNQLQHNLVELAGKPRSTHNNNNVSHNYDQTIQENINEYFCWILIQQSSSQYEYAAIDDSMAQSKEETYSTIGGDGEKYSKSEAEIKGDDGGSKDDQISTEDPPPDEYFVINKYYGSCRRVSEHLLDLEDYYICCDAARYQDSVHLPESLVEVMDYGWLSFFDEALNSCYWMHLATGRVEYYLPIGHDHYLYELHTDLQPYEPYSEWFLADQTPCYEWIVIIYFKHAEHESDWNSSACDKFDGERQVKGGSDADVKAEMKSGLQRRTRSGNMSDSDRNQEKLHDDYSTSGVDTGWYYYNQMVGCSSWEAPVGWEHILESNGGWALCSQEGVEGCYWWHEETGVTAFADVEEAKY